MRRKEKILEDNPQNFSTFDENIKTQIQEDQENPSQKEKKRKNEENDTNLHYKQISGKPMIKRRF